jgi:hypothetical protein
LPTSGRSGVSSGWCSRWPPALGPRARAPGLRRSASPGRGVLRRGNASHRRRAVAGYRRRARAQYLDARRRCAAGQPPTRTRPLTPRRCPRPPGRRPCRRLVARAARPRGGQAQQPAPAKPARAAGRRLPGARRASLAARRESCSPRSRGVSEPSGRSRPCPR